MIDPGTDDSYFSTYSLSLFQQSNPTSFSIKSSRSFLFDKQYVKHDVRIQSRPVWTKIISASISLYLPSTHTTQGHTKAWEELIRNLFV